MATLVSMTACTSKKSSTTSPTPSGGTRTTSTFVLGYEPLWPFRTFADAEQWRISGGGSQPWHLDAGQTALNFTKGYLGFTEIDRVTKTVSDAKGAHVSVGYLNPSGQKMTAAVLHLVRFGPSNNSPWEVVGSDDTDFSIENPAYGSTLSSPVTMGGHISGVDENIHVWARSLASTAPVGEKCCLPAGGQNSPWSVSFDVRATGTTTLVASTGGHVNRVERFAVQGVNVR